MSCFGAASFQATGEKKQFVTKKLMVLDQKKKNKMLEILLSLWGYKTRKQLKMAIFHPHFQILYSN